MLTVFGVKGWPGATTSALLAAALWPTPAVLVEADPAGGDLALRLAGPAGQVLPRTPSLADLAVESAAAMGISQPSDHALQTRVGVPVVCGVLEADPMGKAIRQHARAMADALRGTDTVVDAGRLVPGSPALPIAEAADAVTLVTGDSAEQFFHARDLLAGLVAAVGGEPHVRPSVQVIVVAGEGRGVAAVAELRAALNYRGLPVTVAGSIAFDRKGLDRWLAADRGSDRSILLRSAKPVVAKIAAADADVRAARGATHSVGDSGVSLHAG